MNLLLEGKKQAFEILQSKEKVETLARFDPTPTKKYIIVFAKAYKKETGEQGKYSDFVKESFLSELEELNPMIAECEKRGFKIDVSSIDTLEALRSELQKNLKKITGGKKKMGLPGMKEGEDYAVVYHKGLVWGYTPFNWEASKVLGSQYLKGCEGKWCTSYQKSNYHWNEQQGNTHRLVIVVDYSEESSWDKIAIKIDIEGLDEFEIWDKYDHRQPEFFLSEFGMDKNDISNIRNKLIEFNNEEKYDIGSSKVYFIIANSSGDTFSEDSDEEFDGNFDIWCSLYSRSEGNDEIEEENEQDSICNGSIKYMERGTFIGGKYENLEFMLGINTENNNGVIIQADGFDSYDEFSYLADKWEKKYSPLERDNDVDTYEISRVIEEVLSNKEINYVIVNTDKNLNYTIVDRIVDLDIISDDDDRESLRSGDYSNSVEYLDNTWYLYTLPSYRATSGNNDLKASTPTQRKRDKQLNFVYESFPRRKHRTN